MPLIDALLLDPAPFDVWIAYRTDGVGGSGTQADPYDGSTLAKFDLLMRDSVGTNTRVHLGPGEFQTAGYYDGIGGTYWQAKTGMWIVGSGIDVTTLTLVSAATTQPRGHFVYRKTGLRRRNQRGVRPPPVAPRRTQLGEAGWP